jgi:hypothetical protein
MMSQEFAAGCFAALSSRCVLFDGGFLKSKRSATLEENQGMFDIDPVKLTPARKAGLHPIDGIVHSIRNDGSTDIVLNTLAYRCFFGQDGFG